MLLLDWCVMLASWASWTSLIVINLLVSKLLLMVNCCILVRLASSRDIIKIGQSTQ